VPLRAAVLPLRRQCGESALVLRRDLECALDLPLADLMGRRLLWRFVGGAVAAADGGLLLLLDAAEGGGGVPVCLARGMGLGFARV